jgi:hypothetical protein
LGGGGGASKRVGSVTFIFPMRPGPRINLFQQLSAPSNSPRLDAFGHDRQAPIRVLLTFGREIVAEDVAGHGKIAGTDFLNFFIF